MYRSRRVLAVQAAVLLGGLLAVASPASATKPQPASPAGNFSCRASLVRVAGEGLLDGVLIEPIVANPPGNPCVTSTAGVLNTELDVIKGALSVDLKLLYADTVSQKNSATAETGVALLRIEVAGQVIEAEVLTAEAAGSCRAGVPQLSSESVVVGLRVNNVSVEVPNGHFEVAIPLVGTLHLNETIPGSNMVTQRALWLDTGLVGDVIVAEAVADIHGNPCGSDPKTPRTPRGWMTGGGSIFGANNDRITHGMRLECVPADGSNNLQVNWPNNGWHLETVSTSKCSETSLEQGQPTANFDTITGTGTGRCRNGGTATAAWTATDDGEPGTNDSFEITITGACNLTKTTGTLDRGNHQAHGRV